MAQAKQPVSYTHLAEYYSADLSEKVVRGMTENALKGIYNGGTIPFGYMIDETRHYQPDPLLAPYVEQTFQKLSLIHI